MFNGVNMISMAEFKNLLPIILPIMVIQVTLAVVAVVKLVRQKEFRYLNKVSWLLIVILLQLIGPVCYFVFGRGDE